MAILADKDSRVIIQGITGNEANYHTQQMIKYGTHIVGGVTPGKGGEWAHGKPVFDSVRKALDATGANATVIFVPAESALDAIVEAIDAGIDLIVCITKGIPILDMTKIREHSAHSYSRLIGPNTPGLLTPGQAQLGIMPGSIGTPGNIGVVSKSGALMYEVVYTLNKTGLGQTTCVGIGGDPITGQNFVDILRLFEEDPETEKIVMIGEIGGRAEINAAEFIKSSVTKPITAFIAGKSAPAGIQMGHAGAIIEGNEDSAMGKIQALLEAGVRVADNPEQIPRLLK
jgi:succinyl-CoA synthetase alpha subunit